MAAIQGLPDITKEEIAAYCRRQGITQIQWCKRHLKEDLKAEQEEKAKNEKTN